MSYGNGDGNVDGYGYGDGDGYGNGDGYGDGYGYGYGDGYGNGDGTHNPRLTLARHLVGTLAAREGMPSATVADLVMLAVSP